MNFSDDEMKALTTQANTIKTPTDARDLVQSLILDGAADYSSLVDIVDAAVTEHGIFADDKESAKLAGFSLSSARRYRDFGKFPQSIRVTPTRIACNRYTLCAFQILIAARADTSEAA